MPIQWSTPEAKDRLFLAVIAACEPKLDYRRIATFYGQGATYDAIEGQFRKIRNGAKELRTKVEAGEIAAAPPRGGKSNPKTPSKPKEKTIGGRVTKSANNTPTKRSKPAPIIKEEANSSTSSFFESSGQEGNDWSNEGSQIMDGGDFGFFYDQGDMEQGV